MGKDGEEETAKVGESVSQKGSGLMQIHYDSCYKWTTQVSHTGVFANKHVATSPQSQVLAAAEVLMQLEFIGCLK